MAVMAGHDKNTAGYQMHVIIKLTEVNKYGDKIGDGELSYTKTLKAKSLTELGVILARVEDLGE